MLICFFKFIFYHNMLLKCDYTQYKYHNVIYDKQVLNYIPKLLTNVTLQIKITNVINVTISKSCNRI